MSDFFVILPILPGKREAWLRFVQELRSARRAEYAAVRRAVGVIREQFWLLDQGSTPLALITGTVAGNSDYLRILKGSDRPFDRWFRRQLLELHDVDARQVSVPGAGELAFEWQDQRTGADDGEEVGKGGG